MFSQNQVWKKHALVLLTCFVSAVSLGVGGSRDGGDGGKVPRYRWYCDSVNGSVKLWISPGGFQLKLEDASEPAVTFHGLRPETFRVTEPVLPSSPTVWKDAGFVEAYRVYETKDQPASLAVSLYLERPVAGLPYRYEGKLSLRTATQKYNAHALLCKWMEATGVDPVFDRTWFKDVLGK